MAEFKEISPNASATAKLTNWFENRFPTAFYEYKKHMSEYYAPKNFNFWYFFGSLSLLVLVIQIVTGIFLVMHYKPDANQAFASVEYIMRDVPWGWLIRYIHSTGASAFFIVVYLHMFRGLIYGSYRKPRELIWIFGCAIFLCPCHGSTFDLAGRVFKNKPAPDNLEVPPYTFLSDSRLLIGESKQA